jgi:hypothetical protein
MSDQRPGEEDSQNESDSELQVIGQQEVEEMDIDQGLEQTVISDLNYFDDIEVGAKELVGEEITSGFQEMMDRMEVYGRTQSVGTQTSPNTPPPKVKTTEITISEESFEDERMDLDTTRSRYAISWF